MMNGNIGLWKDGPTLCSHNGKCLAAIWGNVILNSQ